MDSQHRRIASAALLVVAPLTLQTAPGATASGATTDPTWTPVIAVFAGRTAVSQTGVLVSSNGDTTIVWSRGSRIFAARRPPQHEWGEPVVLGRGTQPTAAVDGRGRVTALWVDGSYRHLLTRRFRPAQDRWEPVVQLTRRTAEAYAEPWSARLVANESGRTLAVWNRSYGEYDDVADSAVEWATRPSVGPWTRAQTLTRNALEVAGLTLDRHGDAALFVTPFARSAVGAFRRPAGKKWGALRILPDTRGMLLEAVAGNSRGDHVLLLSRRGNVWARRKAEGSSWSADTWVAWTSLDGLASGPQLVLDDKGAATVAFANESLDGAMSVIRGAPRGTWSLPVALGPVGENVGSVRLAANPDGDVLLTWVRDPAAETPSVQAAYRLAGGWWSATAELAGSPAEVDWLGGAVHRNGDALAAWWSPRTDSSGSGSSLSIREMTAPEAG